MLTVLIGMAGLVLLSLFGIPVLALLPGSVRYRLIPSLPVFGVIFVVVVSHAFVWAAPMSITAWIVVAVAVIISVLGFRAHPIRWRCARQSAKWGALVAGTGAIGALLAWTPSFLIRSNLLVQPSGNYDAVWYVAAATWLKDHSLLQAPSIGLSPSTGMDAVFFGPAAEAAMNFTRLGQEMVLATLSAVTGIDLVAGFSSWIGVWVLLGASAAWTFGEMFRLSGLSRLVLGLLLSVSSVVMFQVAAGNASSLLGAALIITALGAVGSTLRRDGRRAVPRWVAGASVSAVLGVYSEYLPFMAVALAAIVLVAPRREIVGRLQSAIVIVGFSVALAPVIWFRSIKSLLFVGGIAAGGGGQADPAAALAGLLGPLSTYGSDLTGFTQLLAAAAVAAVAFVGIMGLIFGVVFPRTRGLAIGSGLGSVVIALYLIFSANSYIGHRAVDMITPLVIVSAGCGWIEFRRRSSGWKVGARRGVGIVTTAAVIGVAAVNISYSAYRMTYQVWTGNYVSEDFSQVDGWIATDVDKSGDDLTIATAVLFDQLWLAEVVDERPDVAWVNLRGDLGYRANGGLTSFWDGELDRYLLLGPGAFASSDVVPVKHNDRFSLIDWSSSAGAVVIPDSTSGMWNWTVDSGIATSATSAAVRVVAGSGGGEYVVHIDKLKPGAVARFDVGGNEIQVPVSPEGTADIPLTIASKSSIEITVSAPTGFRLQGVAPSKDAP